MAPAPFPPLLAQVAPPERVTQTFGVGFGAVGIGGIILAAAYLIELARHRFADVYALEYFGAAAAVGLPCAAYEIYRRRNATTIVPGEGRKPKADPMAKRTPGIPGPSACHEPFCT